MAYTANSIGNLGGSLQPLADGDNGRLNNGAPSKSRGMSSASYDNNNAIGHNTFMDRVVDGGEGTSFTRDGKEFFGENGFSKQVGEGTATEDFSYNTTQNDRNDYEDGVARQNAITAIYQIGSSGNVLAERNKNEG